MVVNGRGFQQVTAFFWISSPAPNAISVYHLGIPIYYQLLGRRLLGQAMKYPLLRPGHCPEWLRKKLCRGFTGNGRPAFLGSADSVNRVSPAFVHPSER
jgi:hypothetical protein